MENFKLYILANEREKHQRNSIKELRKELEVLDSQLKYLELLQNLKAGFNPNQPRVPAGNSDGGQWTDGGGGSSSGGGGGAGRFDALPRAEEKPKPISRPHEGTQRTTHFRDLDGKIRKIPKGVGNPRTFERHVNDHAKHFGAESGNDYLKEAQKFRNRGIKNKLPMIQDADGIHKIYDPKTNTFGAYNKDGSLKTYTKPKNTPLEGYKYYEREVQRILKRGGKVINPLPPRNSGGGRGPGFINPKDPFDEFPDDILKYFEPLVERKYFPATKDCDNKLTKENDMAYTCPVCGFNDLDEAPETDSYEICPSCGIEFGLDNVDDDPEEVIYEKWREKWIAGGMVWDKGRSEPPEAWDPKKQLLNIGVKI